MLNQNKRLILLILTLFLVLSGCSLPWRKKAAPVTLVFPKSDAEAVVAEEEAESVVEPDTNKVKKFANYEELAAWMAENSNPESFLLRSSWQGQVMTDAAFSKTVQPGVSDLTSNSSVPDYSTTNNQVVGVDEADIIKTDGSYVYALVRNDLLIIKVSPPVSSEIVGKISFESRPQDIFISGQNLAVFGSDNQIGTMPFYQKIRRYNPYSFFMVFDVSNPAQPEIRRDLKFEGSYSAARLIGDYVYFITSTPGSYLVNEPLVPRLIDSGVEMSSDCQSGGKCFSPDVYYFDIPYDSYDFTNISAINIKDATEPVSGDIYLLNSGQELFVSEKNIYVTYTQNLSEYEIEQTVRKELVIPLLDDVDQERVADIEKSPGHVLNNHEKKTKIAQIIDRYISALKTDEQKKIFSDIDKVLEKKLTEAANQLERTVIHKVGINGNKLEYLAMGEVPGRLLNQFSMDEFEGNFRIATTRSEQWSRLSGVAAPSYSNLYVLDKELKIIGRLEKLATTERIYSVRFLGQRAYIVTFKQTDPLFAISLADPTKPSVLNAIKVPGFSNYLHPVDSTGNKLFGLGRQTEETAGGGVKVLGVKLSLYDFSDASKPQELDSFLIGEADSDSIALNDHRAFLYSKEKNILVIPAVLRENGRLVFAGSLVFGVEDNKLSLKGRIDHSAGGYFSEPDFWDGYSYYDNTVKRSLYIDNNLFTFSNKFLKVNNLDDLSEVKSLQLTSSRDDYIITPVTPEVDNLSAESGEVTSNESTLPLEGEPDPGQEPVPNNEPVEDPAMEDWPVVN